MTAPGLPNTELDGGEPHSAVILLARISLPHFSVSCATRAESSCGVEAMGTAPLAASFSGREPGAR